MYANKTHAKQCPQQFLFLKKSSNSFFLNACSVISNNTIDYIFHSEKNPCSSNISVYTPHKLEHLMDIKCSLSTVQMLINMVNGCPRKKS